ncbi:hypothetical protein J7443_24765, partial [Tropicibacter sp. R15_0]|uniref:hypothetical protein n=1 Tax=Tropicibacter sp. R15_0 TaxID=2821101 RepID=UPI001ADA900F
ILQLAEASIQSLRVSLFSQPSLILQFTGQSIPVGGPLSGGYSNTTIRDPAIRAEFLRTVEAWAEDQWCIVGKG